jgi:hypothetical protein
VGGAADLERFAVEVFAAQGQDLPQPQAGVSEDAGHRLVAAGRLGEAVHLLEAEDADRAGLLPRSWIVRMDADALERIEVADFVGDRVLGHRRERAEDADGSGGGSAFDSQHVVNQGEGVAAAQLVQWPVLELNALNLHVEDSADSVVVRGVGAFRAWVAFGPGGGVVAEGVGLLGDTVRLFDRPLRVGLALEVPLPRFQVGLAMWCLPSRPV